MLPPQHCIIQKAEGHKWASWRIIRNGTGWKKGQKRLKLKIIFIIILIYFNIFFVNKRVLTNLKLQDILAKSLSNIS